MGLLSSLFGGKQSAEELKEKQDQKNFEILKYDGMRARNIRRIDYAIKCFEEALAIKEDTETCAMLASTYLQAGKIEEAKAILEKVTEKEPENTNALISLAGVCFLLEDYTQMQKICEKAIACDGNNAMAYYLAGKANKSLGNGIQSIVMLSKALAQKEDFLEAYQLRAEVLAEMNQADESKKDIEKILTMDENNEEALLLKGEILIKKESWEEATQVFSTILSLNPFCEKAYILKAEIMIKQGNNKAAIAIYDEAIELSGDNAKLFEERGRAKLLDGDKEGSMADAKKAMELNPEKENEISEKFNGINTNSAASIY